jgi:hypothetical protein
VLIVAVARPESGSEGPAKLKQAAAQELQSMTIQSKQRGGLPSHERNNLKKLSACRSRSSWKKEVLVLTTGHG